LVSEIPGDAIFPLANEIMQRNNLIVFVIIAVCIIAGWYFFMLPSEADRQKQAEEAKKAFELRQAELKDKKRKQEEEAAAAKAKKDAEKKKEDDKNPPEPVKKPEVKDTRKEEKLETATLGGEIDPTTKKNLFHLSVDVTSLGAGVRKLTLNRFGAANWRGLPVREVNEDGSFKVNQDGAFELKKMQLIQDDEFSPSYRMYHYLDPKAENPVLGLGEQIWKLLKPEKEETIARDGGGATVKRIDGKIVEKDADGNILSEEISFSTMVPDMNVAIVKTYKLGAKDYHVSMKLTIEDRRTDKNAKAILFRYQLSGAQGLPIEGEWYASTYRNAFMALVDPNGAVSRKLEDASRISLRRGGDRFPEDTRAVNRFQYAGVANQFFAAMIVVEPDEKGGRPRDLLAWARPTLESVETKGRITKLDYARDMIEFRDDKGDKLEYHLLPRTKHHLKEDLDVQENQKIVLSHYKLPDGKLIATWARLGETPRPQFDDITVRVVSEKIELFPGDKIEQPFMLYHGPVKVALLAQFTGEKAVDPDLVEYYRTTLHLNTLTDYQNDNWLGAISSRIFLTDVIITVTRFMHWLLYQLHKIFGWGLSIVVLTVMVRGAMFPISRRQALFSIRMQELGPELKKIQEKYPDDAQAKMQATQEFYRKHGINPLGSCWPVFLQMPIFLGLYFAFQESIHFRLADFLWIENLAAPDMLFGWSDHIPWISDPNNLGGMLYLGPYLNILPMIAVVFMQIQQSQTMPPPTDEQQAAQQKMLKYMTIFFGVMFYKVAAGLCIYFISSSLWGLAERKLLPKKKPIGDTAMSTATAGASTAITAAPKWKGKNAKKDREKEKAKDSAPATTMGKLKALWRDILRAAEKK
jgi:YidC/Oxa1 family membrane protein insertase